MPCRIRRTKETSMRLLHECRYWKDSVFVTFTYDDEHLTCTPCGKCFLVPEHLKNFWKRLRQDIKMKDRKFKYYAVSEYGDISGRSHFHAIVFGLSTRDKDLFQKHWSYGFTYCGTVTSKSCDYVAGYVQKKLTGKALELKEDSVCQFVPNYPRVMASGGLGLRYAQSHEQQFITSGITVNGCRVGIPRYYRKKLPRLDANCLVRADKFITSQTSEDIKRYTYNIDSEVLEHKWQKFCEARSKASMKKGKV